MHQRIRKFRVILMFYPVSPLPTPVRILCPQSVFIRDLVTLPLCAQLRSWRSTTRFQSWVEHNIERFEWTGEKHLEHALPLTDTARNVPRSNEASQLLESNTSTVPLTQLS